MIYVFWKNYRGGINNLSIARDIKTGLCSTSLKSDKQAIINLKNLINRKAKNEK